MSEDTKKEELHESDGSCYGYYGKYFHCPTCKNSLSCKSFSYNVEKGKHERYVSKYKGRGKRKRRPTY